MKYAVASFMAAMLMFFWAFVLAAAGIGMAANFVGGAGLCFITMSAIIAIIDVLRP